jgi:hypothetical protein
MVVFLISIEKGMAAETMGRISVPNPASESAIGLAFSIARSDFF